MHSIAVFQEIKKFRKPTYLIIYIRGLCPTVKRFSGLSVVDEILSHIAFPKSIGIVIVNEYFHVCVCYYVTVLMSGTIAISLLYVFFCRQLETSFYNLAFRPS